jgi:hypothetical protein
MIITRCLTFPLFCCGSCCPAIAVCRCVVVLLVLVLAVVLALQGYAPGDITGPVLMLVAGAVAVTDRLIGVQRVRAVSALPSS